MMLCDVLDHHSHEPITSFTARSAEKADRAFEADMGFDPMMATELEFFLFEKVSMRSENLVSAIWQPISGYNEDYHILQTTKEEHVMRPIRNHLYAAGLPIEGTKGEAEAGQEELNIRYAAPRSTPRIITRSPNTQSRKLPGSNGHAATFLPKWDHNRVGSSSHVHQSLWKDGKPAFL
jgi:glutamine synthetase